MFILYYLLVGLILYFSTIKPATLKEKLPKQYIAYRCEEIAKGNDPFDESTFRKIFVTFLILVFLLGWPVLLLRSIYRALFK